MGLGQSSSKGVYAVGNVGPGAQGRCSVQDFCNTHQEKTSILNQKETTEKDPNQIKESKRNKKNMSQKHYSEGVSPLVGTRHGWWP